MVWDGMLIGEDFALHANICNLDYMSFLQSPGTAGQITRLNRLSHIYIYIYKSSMNTVIFVKAITGFSENLFLVFSLYLVHDGHNYHRKI